MKSNLLVLAVVVMTAFTFAADITLKDGRVLRGAEVKAETPRSVMIKHAGGLSSVSKELLPSELQARHPIDEAAAREAEQKAVVARQAAVEARKAESDRLARRLADHEPASQAKDAVIVTQEDGRMSEIARVKARAYGLATKYFLRDYSWSPTEERTCDVTIFDARPVEGWTGRWLVSGRVVIRRYTATGYVPEVNPRGLSAKQIQRAEALNRAYTSETRDFEAHYSAEGTEPTLDVTMR